MSAKIALLPGDGIGPEVMAEAIKVLNVVADRFGHVLEVEEKLVGGAALDRVNSPLPDETLASCRDADAILLGAVGGPKWDDPERSIRPEQGLLRLRTELGLFANLRPVRVHPAMVGVVPLRPDIVEGADLLVVRELTGGIYFGARGRREHASGVQAFDTMTYSTGEIERIARVAGRLAGQRSGRLTSVDKANILESSRLWRSTVSRVMRDEFPEVQLDHVLVDAAAMYLIQRPTCFDVLVTSNLFGDILTDEASVLAGSMGLLPSASLGSDGPGLYEPVHGSAPDIAGRGIANPIGMIASAALMCRWSLKWTAAADCIEAAVACVLEDGARMADIAESGKPLFSTAEMGTKIAEAAAQLEVDTEEHQETPCVPT
ncbi:MAG: 3-isopropylmalate dehydrogenase [bacterium]|nr:3-isopropylmalate dehydrogenase [bacterium]